MAKEKNLENQEALWEVDSPYFQEETIGDIIEEKLKDTSNENLLSYFKVKLSIIIRKINHFRKSLVNTPQWKGLIEP